MTKLWPAQTVSVFGSQVTTVALALTAVLTLHATALQMGLLRAAGAVPALLIGLFAGVWVDCLPRRPLLVWADLGRAALLGSIPCAALLGALLGGALGQVVGPRLALLALGVGLLCAPLWLILSPIPSLREPPAPVDEPAGIV